MCVYPDAMSDAGDIPERLLDVARSLRAEAARALDIAEKTTNEDERNGLRSLAARWLERAQELERRVAGNDPSET